MDLCIFLDRKHFPETVRVFGVVSEKQNDTITNLNTKLIFSRNPKQLNCWMGFCRVSNVRCPDELLRLKFKQLIFGCNRGISNVRCPDELLEPYLIGLFRQMKCGVRIPPNSWYLLPLYLTDSQPECFRGTRVVVSIVSVNQNLGSAVLSIELVQKHAVLEFEYLMLPVPVLTMRQMLLVLKSVS